VSGPQFDVRGWSWAPRRGRGEYGILSVRIKAARRRRVEVTVSPTGRSVQIHVDGRRWVPES
jgi:hypothetical protein